MQNDSDISAVEKKTWARLTVDWQWWKTYAVTHAFKGGKIKLSNEKLGKIDASQWSEDVVVAEGNITVTEPISKLGFDIQAKGSGAAYVSALRMFVDGEEFEARKSGTTFSFSNVEIEKSGKIQFKIDIQDIEAAQNKDITFEPNFNGDAFAWARYDNSRDDVNTGDVSGVISFSNVTIQAAKATLKSTLSDAAEFTNGETNSDVVFEGTYTAKKSLINLNKFYMSGAANPAKVKITYYLYLDGSDDYVASVDTYGSGAEEMFDDVEVKAGASVDVKVVAEVEAYGNTWTISWVQVVLWGTDEFGKDVEYKAGKLVDMKIVENGSVTIDAGASKNTVLKTSNNEVLGEFTVKGSNKATTELDSLEFTITKVTWETFEKEDIEISSVDIEDCTYSAGKVTCTDMRVSLPETVTISFNTKKAGEYTLTIDSINGKKQSKKFSKRFEKALVYVKNQEKKGDETVFTLGVDSTDSNLEVSNVHVYVNWTVVSGTHASIADTFADGAELRFANGTALQYIDGISYHWELDGATWDVRINSDPYKDYFAVGNDYAKIFKASSD